MENFEIIIVLCDGTTESKIDIEIESDKKIFDLKDACCSKKEELENKKENIYFIFDGRVLQDEDKLSEIRDIENGITIHLKIKSENRQEPDPEQHQILHNPVTLHLNNAKVLRENLYIRVKGAQMNKEPALLERRDTSNDACPDNAVPRVRDFGEFISSAAETLLIWSHQLNELGEILKEDKAFGPDRTAPEYARARKCIQNNMDASRYAASMFSAISRFVIPLAQQPGQHGRELRIVQNRR